MMDMVVAGWQAVDGFCTIEDGYAVVGTWLSMLGLLLMNDDNYLAILSDLLYHMLVLEGVVQLDYADGFNWRRSLGKRNRAVEALGKF